jgi:type II secretory pathway component PulF
LTPASGFGLLTAEARQFFSDTCRPLSKRTAAMTLGAFLLPTWNWILIIALVVIVIVLMIIKKKQQE